MATPHIVLRIVMFIVWLGMLVVLGLSYAGKLGVSPQEVLDKNDTALTPEWYTFYSLVIIGALAGLGCLYALFPPGYDGKDKWKGTTVIAVGPWWIIGFVCEILWFCLWAVKESQQKGAFIVSLILQVLGLLSFAIAYGVLMKATSEHAKETNRSVSWPSYVLFYIPTTMNLAWLTIGTSITLMTVIGRYVPSFTADADPDHENDQILAIVLMVTVTFVALLIEGFHASIFYGLTLIWTTVGIFIRKKKQTEEFGIMKEALLVCLVLLCLSTFMSIAISIYRACRKPDEKEEPLTLEDEEAHKADDAPQV